MSAVPESGLNGKLDERYNYPVPPPGGWTADDLDRLPDLPPHTELIDGSLVFVSPQLHFHTRTMRLLEVALADQAPEEFDVDREMTVRLDDHNRPEPDVLLFRVQGESDPDRTAYRPEDVVLAIEVVSDDSRARDREVKPRKYAEAGIPYFWRVEKDPKGLPVVYAYELDPATRAYGILGIFHDKLTLSVPFDIEIDLTAVYARRLTR